MQTVACRTEAKICVGRQRRRAVPLLPSPRFSACVALVLAWCAGSFGAGGATATIAQPPRPAARWRLEDHAMAVAADKRAVDAAVDAMKQGGSAVDAAIAAHAVLGLVEPQRSGLGGGGFMVVYDRKSGSTTGFDGRETAAG